MSKHHPDRAQQDGMGYAAGGGDQNPADFQVRRPDTLQFGSIEGLERMAGVSRHRLRRLILKEVADNAADECDRVGRPGQVSIQRKGHDRYIISDKGRGIPGDAAALADLFSSGRANAVEKIPAPAGARGIGKWPARSGGGSRVVSRNDHHRGARSANRFATAASRAD
jgi:hypothetical protein